MVIVFRTAAWVAVLLALVTQAGFAAETVRPPVWAGKFYPGDRQTLQRTIAQLTRQARQTPDRPLPAGSLKALVLPHAGYIYSGVTAAHAHRVLAGKHLSKVILMGPDHRVGFAQAAVSDADAFQTPLGQVGLHEDARQLARNSGLFRPIPASDRSEHCLEVILPFLQTYMAGFRLVPVVLGPSDPKRIGEVLDPLLDDRTLLVVSADLSHYLPYDQATAKDRDTIEAILNLDAAPLLSDANRSCGKYPLAVLIYLARKHRWRPALLHYANSGDTAGDRQAVVGYTAIAFLGEIMMQFPTSQLTREQGQALVQLARLTLQEQLGRKKAAETKTRLEKRLKDPALQAPCGTFVTLTIGGQLRGCIGNLIARDSLVAGVRANALNAAFHDPRFKPLTDRELDRTQIEVSVLTEPQPLAYEDADDLKTKLRPHIDGVTLRQGFSSATFLPQVWDQLPRAEDFLTQLCLKAGLSAEAWRKGKLEVETYQVQYFEEPH